MFAYIVDASLRSVYIRNDTNIDIVIPRKVRLGTIEEFSYNRYYIVDPYNAGLAASK